ncbi:MAG TPA: Ig-like domain-containing protein [Gemmatimonadales bacterium]|nr:Ig-like domain-containing protein [Gemmatimonadales bacterium]
MVALPLVWATVGTCVFPTEHDASVHVSITPLHILLRGTTVVRRATAWQIISATDSQPIPNVRFVWSSSDPLTAAVDNEGHIVGIKSGSVTITAAAANFDKQARPGRDTVRVSAALEIDSVSPDTVRYGDRLSIYGVGVDSIIQASLGSGPGGRAAVLFPVPFSTTEYANGTARSRYWVPPPATTDSLLFFGIANGSGVFGFVHNSITKVIPHDLYDPNQINPRRLDLTGPGPFPTVWPDTLLWNPALAFEELPVGATSGADWYRFHFAPPKNVTVIIESPELAGTFQTFLSDSLGWSGTAKRYFIGHDSWTFGPGSHACHGLRFNPPELTGDSTIVAFKGLTLDSLDAVAAYGQPGRYGLAVIGAYQSELPADAHEDDNSCNAADARGAQLVGTNGFRDTLAIENPHDIDWIRFTAPNPMPVTGVEFKLAPRPGGINPDSIKIVQLYVIKVPAASDTALAVVLRDTAVAKLATRDTTLATLTAGQDYYAVVLDYAGVTTYYELCVQPAPTIVGPSCAGAAWPAPPAATAARTTSLSRTPAPTRSPAQAHRRRARPAPRGPLLRVGPP